MTTRKAPPPFKTDAETYSVIEQGAHFLGVTKKDYRAAAAREHAANHRYEIEAGVKKALELLDGSLTSEVSLLTGFSREDLEELGGLGE